MMATSIILGVESASSNSSFRASKPLTLALATALAVCTPVQRVQGNPDVTVRTKVHGRTAQASTIATKEVLQARWNKLRSKIASFRELAPNWDGHESIAPKPETVDAILQALAQLPIDMPLPKPLLSNDGEIGVYWTSGNAFADLTIDAQGEMSLYVRNLDKEGGTLTVIPHPNALDRDIITKLSTHLA